ncbi:MFS transporter [Nonomuraea thailandensis]
MFVLGMILYGVASLLGGLAGAPGALVGARALQGLGGAVLMPATLSLVVTMFEEGRARNRAMTVWAVCGASGMSVGALLGGVLTGAFGWEAVFFVNVPLAVVAVVAAFGVLAPDGERRAGGFDLPGALTGTAGVTGLVFAISRGAEWGWGSAGVLVPLVAAVGLLVAFVVIEARSRSPLMPLRLLANRHTSAAAGAILLYGMSMQCVPYFLTLHFQDVLGYDAMQSGLAFLGPTLGIALGNLVGERLIPRIGLRGTLLLSVLVGVAAPVCWPSVCPWTVRTSGCSWGPSASGWGPGCRSPPCSSLPLPGWPRMSRGGVRALVHGPAGRERGGAGCAGGGGRPWGRGTGR